MSYRLLTLNSLGWVIGPTVWISSVALMIHGLWTGAWYGYVFAAILLATAGTILLVIHRANRMAHAEFERFFSEWQAMDDSDP